NDKAEAKTLKKIAKLPFKTLFIDGCNENFDVLSSYPDTLYGSAGAKEIYKDKIYYIKRGEVLELEGIKLLCFGGGEGLDEFMFDNNPPSQADFENCVANLKKHQFKVDYILTHSPSGKINRFINMDSHSTGNLFDFLDLVYEKVDYRRWYFGSIHADKYISPKAQGVYTEIYQLI
ncbi:MAG: hypothetical protein RR253_00815, partial [Oscillospiraceae bacterium]